MISQTNVFRAGILCMLMFGCSGAGSSGPTASLQGIVRLNGEPFTEGRVAIYSAASGTGGAIPIDHQGRYSTKSTLALGEYEVSIQPPLFTPPGPGEKRKKSVSVIPQKYQLPKTSGLKVTLERGRNTFDINMQP